MIVEIVPNQRSCRLREIKLQTGLHGDGSNQLDGNRHVIARHTHFDAFRQMGYAGHVGGAEIELRAIAVKERLMTAAFGRSEHRPDR